MDLLAQKANVSHLENRDLLRRDYKEYTYTLPGAPVNQTLKAGLSSVPLSLEAMLDKDDDLVQTMVSWMKLREIAVLGVLTSFRKPKGGKKHREMVWVVHDTLEGTIHGTPDLDIDELSAGLWRGLEESAEVRLREHEKTKLGDMPSDVRVRWYEVGNTKASRKVTAPLLKRILENSDL